MKVNCWFCSCQTSAATSNLYAHVYFSGCILIVVHWRCSRSTVIALVVTIVIIAQLCLLLYVTDMLLRRHLRSSIVGWFEQIAFPNPFAQIKPIFIWQRGTSAPLPRLPCYFDQPFAVVCSNGSWSGYPYLLHPLPHPPFYKNGKSPTKIREVRAECPELLHRLAGTDGTRNAAKRSNETGKNKEYPGRRSQRGMAIETKEKEFKWCV